MDEMNGAYVVSWDFTRGEDEKDHAVLIVGKQIKGKIAIVNAFQGQDAHDIYEKLTTVKKEN